MKGHTGLVMSYGHGAAYSASLKQKINTLSSTETELVGISDGMPKNMWVLYFTEAQGRIVKDNILNEDNTSCIRLAKNGKRSSGNMTKHIKIRYFFVTNRIEAKELSIQHCPTLDMIADYFTKPLQGKLFRKFRDLIMGISMNDYEQYKARYKVLSLLRKQIKDVRKNKLDKAWAVNKGVNDGKPKPTNE